MNNCMLVCVETGLSSGSLSIVQESLVEVELGRRAKYETALRTGQSVAGVGKGKKEVTEQQHDLYTPRKRRLARACALPNAAAAIS